MLNPTEGAHIRDMSIFETGELIRDLSKRALCKYKWQRTECLRQFPSFPITLLLGSSHDYWALARATDARGEALALYARGQCFRACTHKSFRSPANRSMIGRANLHLMNRAMDSSSPSPR